MINSFLSQVPSGSRKLIDLDVGQLPSGTPIRIRAHVLRARKEGPVALLLGGVHGDEINGIEIVRKAVCSSLHDQMTCGTVIAIPLLNVYGFLNYARAMPDGKDVNRSFPGTATGSLASRVAHVLTKQVLPLVDFGLDFHTGGRSHYNYPQVRFSPEDDAARVLAEAFQAPIQLASKTIPKSFRRTAFEENIPVVVYEGGENLRIDTESIEVALNGIQNVLKHQGMLKQSAQLQSVNRKGIKVSPVKPQEAFTSHKWLRATQSGLFEWKVSSGQDVLKGEIIGYLRDPYGLEEIELKAPRDCTVIGHDNSPVINQGDALFHLAWR